MASVAERQERFRERRAREGLLQVTVLIPAAAMADFQEHAEAIRTNPVLTLGPLRNPHTGKLCSVKSVLTPKGNTEQP